jgi:ribonuclease T1
MSNPHRLSSLLLLAIFLLGCTPTPAATTPTARVTDSATTVSATTPTRVRTRAPATPTKRPVTAAPTTVALNCNRTLRGGATPNLPKVTLAALVRCRPEAGNTLRDIQRNGPFDFSRDDITFENRERLLPRADRGAYREYTVITPSESDRGARRLVTIGNTNRDPADYDVLYYTDDHYDSFWIVVER